MCENSQTANCKCIAEILTTINILQDNAERSDDCVDSCDRGFLGSTISSYNFNTRPIMIYTCGSNGQAWRMPTSKENITCDEETATCSNVFRIEKVDGCCATFRVLANNPDTTEIGIPYISTNSFFTMNLNCVCCIKCLNDTFVEGI